MSSRKKSRFENFLSSAKLRFIGAKSKLLRANNEIADLQVQKPLKQAKAPEEILIKFSGANIAKVIVITILLLVLCAFLYQVRQIILILCVAFLLSAALTPTVDWLQARKLPRGLSVILIYVIALAALIAFISNFIPIVGSELLDLGRNIRAFVLDITSGKVVIKGADFIMNPLRDFLATTNFDLIFKDLQGLLVNAGLKLSSLANNAVGVLIALSNGILNLVLVLVLSFFMITEREAIFGFIGRLFPNQYEQYILAKNKAIQVKIGNWLQGQIVLMLVVGLLTYIALLILGADYALTLGVFAGLAELLPVVGPIVAFLVAVPIVANQALWLVLAVGILFLVIQQLENNVLVPMIMKKAVGISPIVVIVSMLIGYQFLSVLGLILSVPVATTISIFIDDFLKPSKKSI